MSGIDINQPLAHKLISSLNKSKEFSHAYMLEMDNFDENEETIISFLKLVSNDCEVSCKCSNCLKIENYTHTEVKFIETQSLNLKKEQIIELQQEFTKKPINSKRKVYVIKEADKLNQSSANTLLKFLEEPNENIIAILVTPNVYNVIETIRSRCQIIRFIPTNNVFFEEIDKFIDVIDCFEEKEKELMFFESRYKDVFKEKDSTLKFLKFGVKVYKDSLDLKVKRFEKTDNKKYNEIVYIISTKNDKKRILHKINVFKQKQDDLKMNQNMNLLIIDLFLNLGGQDE